MLIITDHSRLGQWIIDYFPEPKYSRSDIVDWAKKNVPAWNVMKPKTKENILDDWEDFVAPVFKKEPQKFIVRERERHRRRLREFRRWRRG